MSSIQHQLIEQCVTRLRGIVEALDNIHDTSPQCWSTDLDDVHSSAESLLAMIKDQAPPSEDQLIAAGLSYPLAKEDAVKLWYSGFRSEVITVLEAWEAIGHDTGINPDKEELLESLRNMAAICNAHGNDMPAQSAIDQRQVIADAITGALAFGAQASQAPAADHWLRPFYDIGRAEGQRTQDLAMLVRMLASSLKRHAPESNLVARATNYLAAKGLAGTPLRDPPAPVEQAGGDERVIGWRERILAAHPNSDPGFWPDALLVEHMAAEIADLRAALAHPSPAQAEKAEAERQEVVDFNPYRYHAEKIRQRADGAASAYEAGRSALGYMEDIAESALIVRNGLDELSAQHERITAKLHDALDECDGDRWKLRHERDAANARLHEVATACATAEQERDAALARVAGLRSLLNPILCYVENDIERMRGDRDKSDNKEIYDLAISLAMERLKAAQHAVFTTEPGCDTAVELASHITAQAQHSVPRAWLDVQAERLRQVEAEGWTPEHDDEHACDEIAAFACFYAMPPAARDWDASSTGYGDTLGEAILPEGWEPKTGDRRRDLVKACALALAEIERLDRAGISQNPQPGATRASS